MRKIDLQKIRNAQNTTCPKCGRVIEPAEIRRVSFEEMVCPSCGARFKAGEQAKSKVK